MQKNNGETKAVIVQVYFEVSALAFIYLFCWLFAIPVSYLYFVQTNTFIRCSSRKNYYATEYCHM